MTVIYFSEFEMCFCRHFADPNSRDIPKNHPIPKLIFTAQATVLKFLLAFHTSKKRGRNQGLGMVLLPVFPSRGTKLQLPTMVK